MTNIPTNLSDKPPRLYTTNWVVLATYIGGPLAGAYMMSKNFTAFHRDPLASKTLRIGLFCSLAFFSALPFIPDSLIDQIPRSLIPILYTSVIYQFMVKYQDQEIREHLKNQGLKQSGWKALGIGCLALLISFLYVFILLLVLPEWMIA